VNQNKRELKDLKIAKRELKKILQNLNNCKKILNKIIEKTSSDLVFDILVGKELELNRVITDFDIDYDQIDAQIDLTKNKL